jgi:hypothetical protein
VAAPKSPYTAKEEQQLMGALWDPRLTEDLNKYILFKYPWGKEGTPLEKHKGPRSWQRDELERISIHIADNKNRITRGEAPEMYRSATVSGRGPGKSALVGWLTEWMQDTRLGSTTILTANTEAQLKSRTWAELGKWQTLSINSHWFDRSTLTRRPVPWFESLLQSQLKIDTGYYYAQAQLWSEENPDAFAGVHNHYGVMLIFDEGSGIPQPIWDVSEGFFTEPVENRFWFAFSNGRRNTGAFFECFHRNRNYWHRRHIDSREVEGVDVGALQRIVDQYGEDSDQARVEVRGMFPKQGDKQFIGRQLIEGAINRELQSDPYAPLMLGVDVARFGDDSSVLRWRQGRDARSIPPVKVKGYDNMALANLIAHWADKTNPDAICIDAGNGTGVIDRLRAMGYQVHEVWFGAKAPDPSWANMRIYMWAQMRDWLGGGCIDDDQDLQDDLAGPEYKFVGSSDRQLLESKEEMKKRGLASPDDGDALAVTFAVKVARRDMAAARGGKAKGPVMAKDLDYDIFG